MNWAIYLVSLHIWRVWETSFLPVLQYLALDDFYSQSVTGLVTDGQQHCAGLAGSELKGYWHVQTHSVGRDLDAKRDTLVTLGFFLFLCSVFTGCFTRCRCNTCFQEASAVEIRARLRRLEAPPHHVTGRGRGHVKVEVLWDGLGAAWKGGRGRGTGLQGTGLGMDTSIYIYICTYVTILLNLRTAVKLDSHPVLDKHAEECC